MDFRAVRHASYLELIVFGEFELEEVKRVFTRIIKVCADERMPKVLFDIRQITIARPITLRERFDFAVHTARAAIDARARGMVVTHGVFLGTEQVIDPRRFAITVALNRGAKARATTDEAEALAWLEIEQWEPAESEVRLRP